MFNFLVKKDEKNSFNKNFSIKTLCGENLEFLISEDLILKFFSNGSQLNLITANLICEIFNSKKNLNTDLFWEKFPITLNGYRKESINNILKNFSVEISKFNL